MTDLLMLLALSAGPAPVPAVATDPAEWVPAEALVYVGADDLGVLIDNARKTSGFRLLESDAAADAPYAAFVRKLRDRLAAAVDVSPEQLTNPFAGPAAFYVSAAAGAKLEEATAAVMTIGDRERLSKYYAAAMKKMREAAAKYEAVSAGSYTIDSFTGRPAEPQAAVAESEADDAEEGDEVDPFGMAELDAGAAVDAALERLFSTDSMPASLATCLTPDRLIVAGSADEVKAILRREERGRSLAETDDHRMLVRPLDRPGTLRWVVNVPRIIELARGGAGEESERVAAALGVKCMGSVIGHAVFAPEDVAVEGRGEMVWLRRGEPCGLMKLLSMKNGPLAPPAFVSSAAPMYMALHVDAAALLEEIERITRAVDPDEAEQMRAALEEAGTPDGEKLNLRTELFQNLRPPLTFQLVLTRPASAQSARVLASIGHRDRAAMERLIGMIPMFVAREAAGTQVFDAGMLGISMAASADTVFAGTTAAVEAALQARDGDALSDDATFRRAARAVPPEGWGMAYIDSRRLLDGLLDLLDHADEIEANPMGNPSGLFAISVARGMTGEGQMKPAELRRLLKYYAPGGVTLDTTPAGIRMTWVGLKPDPE